MAKTLSRSCSTACVIAGSGLFFLALQNSPKIPRFDAQDNTTFFSAAAITYALFLLISPKARRFVLRCCCPIVFSFLLPYLLSKDWWRLDQLTACTACAAYTLLLYWTFPKYVRFRRPGSGRYCRNILLLCCSFYFLWTSYYTIIKHYKFLTNGFDLAIFHNAILNASRGTLFQVWCADKLSFFTMHFEPVLSLIVPFYLISPRVETLLIFQAAALALAAVPLYAFAELKLHSARLALVIAVVYLIHPGLHVAQFYDFHEISFLPILFFSMFYFHEKRQLTLFFLATLLCLGIKEDFGIYLFFVFIFLGLTDGWKRHILWGLLLCVGYAWFANWSIRMMGGDPRRLFPAYYYDLQTSPNDGVVAMLLNAVTHPRRTLALILIKDKLLYLIQLFLPLAFLPLFRVKNLVLFLFPSALTLLASSPALYSFNFQYTLYFVAPGVVGVVYFFEPYHRRKRFVRRVTAALLFASFIMSYQYGVIFNQRYVIWQRNGYQGWLKLSREEYAQYLEVRSLVKYIPKDAEGVLCPGELCSHLEHVYHFGQIDDKFPDSAYTANYVLMGKESEAGGQRYGDPVWEKAGLVAAEQTEHFVLYRRLPPGSSTATDTLFNTAPPGQP